MAQQTIGVGTVAGDATGDQCRSAFVKVNANFTELYTAPIISGLVTAGGFVPTSSTIPTNGMYLPVANNLAWSISSAQAMSLVAASLTAPAFIPTSATVPTNGTYLSAANTLAWATASTLRLSVNATGNWTSVAPTAGVAWTINGLTGTHPLVVNGGGATNASTSQVYEPLFSALAVKDIATSDSGTFTGTLTGCTTSPTATFNWVRAGALVTIDCNAGLTATSNTTALTVTGVSAALTPARTQRVAAILTDNTVQVIGWVQIAGTTLSFQMGNPAPTLTGFTAAGTKGVTANMSLTYSLL